MLQYRSTFRNIIYNLFIYQLRLPKKFRETKINIKPRIVERIRKGIFKIIKIFIFILKSKLHSKLVFKVGLLSKKNNSFSVFCNLLRIQTNLFIVHFYAHIDLLQLSQKYPFLQKKFC